MPRHCAVETMTKRPAEVAAAAVSRARLCKGKVEPLRLSALFPRSTTRSSLTCYSINLEATMSAAPETHIVRAECRSLRECSRPNKETDLRVAVIAVLGLPLTLRTTGRRVEARPHCDLLAPHRLLADPMVYRRRSRRRGELGHRNVAAFRFERHRNAEAAPPCI